MMGEAGKGIEVRPGASASRQGIAPATFLSGVLLAVLICFVGGWSSVLRYDLIGTGHLPRSALYPILLFVLVHALMRTGRKAGPGTGEQLLFLYCMILVMASIPGQRFANYFYVNLVGPIFYATPQNQHARLFHGHLRDWLVPSKDPDAPVVRYLFEGLPEGMGFFDIPWGAWVVPILAWMPLILGVLFVTFCLSVLLRRQWVENERLLFPLAEVPLALADQVNGPDAEVPLLRSRLFWICFAIPCVIITVRCFHFYWPEAIPWEWSLRFQTGYLFFESPWHVLNNREVNIYFDTLGITYLLASQIGFSFWFFWLWMRVEEMTRITMGVHDHWEWRYNTNFGGFLALFALYLLAGRGHLRTVVRYAFGRRGGGVREDREEGMPYAVAFWGAVLGTGVIFGWCYLAGIELLWAAVYFLFYFLLLIILTRIVSEAGLFVFWIALPPQEFMFRTFGSEAFSGQTRTVLSMVGFNYHDTASAQMPNFLQAFKIGTEKRLNLRHLSMAILTVLIFSVLACHVTFLWALYDTGIPNAGWWWPGVAGATVGGIVQQSVFLHEPRPRHLGYLLMGGTFTAFLAMMRQRFLWWPFHPLGYVGTSVVERHWFSIFLGWAIKVVVVQVGGVRMWRKLLPAALGIVLGNVFILFTWLLLHFIWPIKGVLVIE